MASPGFESDCSENCDLSTSAKEHLQEITNYKREVKALQQRVNKIRVEAAMLLAEFATLYDPLMRHSLALAHQNCDMTLLSVEQLNSSCFSSQKQVSQPVCEDTLEETSKSTEDALQIVTGSSSADDSAAQEVNVGFSEVQGKIHPFPMKSPDVD